MYVHPDNGSKHTLRNVGSQLNFNTGDHPRRILCIQSPWKFQIFPLITYTKLGTASVFRHGFLTQNNTEKLNCSFMMMLLWLYIYTPTDSPTDDGGSTHLWNVGRQSFYTAVQPRRQLWTSYSPPWELEISHRLITVYRVAEPNDSFMS
jgi:hypothetical protein